jgi:ketosteroid isomerase-like protein
MRRERTWCGLGVLALACGLAACHDSGGGSSPAARTAAVVEAFADAWAGDDPEALSAFYGNEVRSYDATAPGYAFDKETIDDAIRNGWTGGGFEVELTSYFVSADGRFAAVLGTFSSPAAQPYVSLLAFEEARLVWVYDYYGGAMSATEPTPTIPAYSDSGSAEFPAAIADATATLEKWIAAFNNRDADAFLSCYADQVRYVDVVTPDWRVLDRTGLEEDVAAHFARAEFESRLGPSDNSPLGPFLVSADGRYAAVEGAYQDEGTIVAKPMVVILRIEDGVIVEQRNFVVMERDLLEP